jgi:hypothetical protein
LLPALLLWEAERENEVLLDDGSAAARGEAATEDAGAGKRLVLLLLA